MRRCLSVGLGLLLTVFAAGTAAAQDLRFHHWLPPGHPIVTDTLQPWFAEIARVTEGRVQVGYTAAPLAPPPAQFELVRDGVVDMALSAHGFTPGRFVLPTAAGVPFLSADSAPLSVAFHRTHEAFFAAAGEHAGVRVLTMWTTKPGHPWTRDIPVRDVAAFDGLKLAAPNSINVDIAEALGAVAVQAPPSKTYELLQRGIVDGAFVDHSSYKDFNLGTFLKYTTRFEKGLYAGTLYVMINPDSWQRIAEADRAAILEVSGERLARIAGANWDKAARVAEEQMRADGVEVISPDAAMTEEVRARLAFIEARWIEQAGARGVDGAAALAYLRAQIEAETAAR